MIHGFIFGNNYSMMGKETASHFSDYDWIISQYHSGQSTVLATEGVDTAMFV